jgi:hypothetical protein
VGFRPLADSISVYHPNPVDMKMSAWYDARMCVYSMIHDNARRTIPNDYPWVYPLVNPDTFPDTKTVTKKVEDYASKEDVEALRKELKALRELLEAAKKYDEDTGQPDCGVEEKVKWLRDLAKLLGLDWDEQVVTATNSA